MNVANYEVIKKIYRKKDNRWYLSLEASKFRGKRDILQSHYNWLIANPSFTKIPEGYVIHHLDEDKTNDDPSNLALMQRYHHTAHHFKNLKIEVPVEVNENMELPVGIFTEPKYFKRKERSGNGKERWVLYWFEGERGHKKQRRISSYHGKKFTSEEDVKKVRDMIMRSNDVSVRSLGV